ncbi:MAG: hypothetical protein ACO2PL_10440 [Armatimonadota bacterium]
MSSRKKPFPHSPFGVHHSPIAGRHSLPFRLGESIALPFCPPTEVGDY